MTKLERQLGCVRVVYNCSYNNLPSAPDTYYSGLRKWGPDSCLWVLPTADCSTRLPLLHLAESTRYDD